MKNNKRHDFEYYEEQAAYFQYTHTNYFDDEVEPDELDLHPEVIDAVQKKAKNDAESGKRKMGLRELEEFLLDEGLLKYGKTAEVIEDLYCRYEYMFIASKSK